ncbi:MAG: hypothetical protein RIT27_682 [Pseudomonadota bacterium]|jgi:nucleoside-diphosphate-sugar epimerase
MKILITGFSGFVGHQVAEMLKNQGHTLRILLHRHTITRKEYKALGDVEVIWGTFHKPEIVQQAVANVDVVIHSAWSFSKPNAIRPTVNEQGTRLLFEESVKAGVKKFIFLSSVAVYGMQPQNQEMISEQSTLAKGEQADFVYPAEKIAMENWLQEQNRQNMALIIYRPGPIFSESKGPVKGTFKLAFWRFGLNIGNGKNRMAYIHVKDVANAIALGVEKAQDNDVFNLVSTEQLTLKQWIQVWGRYKGLNLRAVFLPPTLMRIMDKGVKLLKKILGKSGGGDIEYVIATSTRDMIYSNEQLKQKLQWSDDLTARYTKLI